MEWILTFVRMTDDEAGFAIDMHARANGVMGRPIYRWPWLARFEHRR
jgi:hypothetical protein